MKHLGIMKIYYQYDDNLQYFLLQALFSKFKILKHTFFKKNQNIK